MGESGMESAESSTRDVAREYDADDSDNSRMMPNIGLQNYMRLSSAKRGEIRSELAAYLPPSVFMTELWSLYSKAVDKNAIRIAHEIMRTMGAYALGLPTKRIEVSSDSASVLETWLADRRPIVLGDGQTIDLLPDDIGDS